MTSMKILIVDDSITIRRIITNALKTVGFPDTVEAANGKDALEKLTSTNVDFIITDWNMPEMNGLDFIKQVRATPDYSSLPILMIKRSAPTSSGSSKIRPPHGIWSKR